MMYIIIVIEIQSSLRGDNMKAFAMFYYKTETGKRSLCGSDCYIPLDARLNVFSMRMVAERQLKSLNTYIHKNLAYYTIHHGDLKRDRIIYDSAPELKIDN
jgi:hypothetical protein